MIAEEGDSGVPFMLRQERMFPADVLGVGDDMRQTGPCRSIRFRKSNALSCGSPQIENLLFFLNNSRNIFPLNHLLVFQVFRIF